ncbi:RICIN domain-containing protein [Galactobacter valiniphilus]|uniref:RICIN domain-containing protein n=1 Tax=Galactobacter valiniphilus TaxID=2676122 RepID=UPI003735FD4A
MRTTPPAPRSRRRSARLGLIVGALAGSLVFGGGAAWAYWTAAATATGTVNTSKVSVSLTGVESTVKPFTNTFASLSQSGTSFTVTNTGTVAGDVKISLSVGSTESAFAAKINLTVWPKVTTCTSTVGAGSTTGTWASITPIAVTGLAAGTSREYCVLSFAAAGANVAGVQALATAAGTQTAGPALTATLTPSASAAWAPATASGTASIKTQDIFALDPAFAASSSSGYGKNYGISLAAGGGAGTRCLDVSGSSTASGSPVITYDCIAPPQSNQIWRAAAGNGTPLSATFSPTHTILTRKLSATAASNPATPNSLSITNQTNAAIRWYLQKTPSGQTQFVSSVDGRCLALDTAGGQKTTLVDCASDAGTKLYLTAR